MDKELSHIDERGRPKMVDVSEKDITNRVAIATAIVNFPANVFQQLEYQEFLGAKGSIFQTAIIAGIQAVKKTSDLIPLCHPLSIKSIDIDIQPQQESHSVKIYAKVKSAGQTGVEMEALTGVSIAALTIYDMTKALSHDIEISEIKLIEKRGGKRDIKK